MISSRPFAAGSPSEGGLDVLGKRSPQLGNLLEKPNRGPFGVRERIDPVVTGLTVMSKCAGDLFAQPMMQRIDQAAHMVGHVGVVQVLPPAVPWVEDLPQVTQDVDDFTIAGQRAVVEVMDRAAFVVGFDNPLRDLFERRLESKIRTHRPGPFASARVESESGILSQS